MNINHSLAIIGVVAVCTIITRVLPFLIFGRHKEIPKLVQYLGGYLPPAIMATLVIYCLKSVELLKGNHGIPELLSVFLVAILHVWRKNTLLSIGAGTVCYMLLVQMVFV